MKVICTQCKATYNIPDSRIPDRKASFPCKRCGQRLIVRPLTAVKAAPKPQAEPRRQPPEAVQAPPAAPAAPATADPPDSRSLITDELPEAKTFDPQKYAMDHLLKPTKKGRYKTRINKLKLKLLGAVQGQLDQLLGQDERVIAVAGGIAYYPVELIFGNGWMTQLYNRYILVGTNQRLVAVNTNYKMTKPSHYLFQFPYNEIKKVSRGLFGTSLTLTRKKSKRRTFTGMKRALSNEIKAFIGTKIDPSADLDAEAPSMENLCPSCYTPLAGGLSSCPECHAVFKSPRKAALRSLLLPGWGDMYLGHRFLGFFELLGSILILAFCLTLFLTNNQADPIVGLVILLIYNGMDSLLSRHMAKKGYSLEKSQPQTAAGGQLSPSQA